MSEQAFAVFVLALVPLAWAFYLLPTIIAFRRRHPNRWLITAINVFLGGTGIGWLGALVWALGAVHVSNVAGGSHGGELGLNLFANDARTIRLAGPVPTADARAPTPPTVAMVVAEIERLCALRTAGHLSEREFADLKADALRRVSAGVSV